MIPGFLVAALPLLTSIVMSAAPGMNFHISVQSLGELDALASHRMDRLEDATAYVRKSAAVCGSPDPAFLPEGFESRLAAVELAAAKNPSSRISDEYLAATFNLISDVLKVQHPARLTATDILQYRAVMASIYPHLYSSKEINGSRPLAAVVMLYQLWYSGGLSLGVRAAAQLDRPAGSLKVTSGHIALHPTKPNEVEADYRGAGLRYFARSSPEEVRSFMNTLMATLIGPERR